MSHDTPLQLRAAPGRLLCKILEDIETDEAGFLLPDKQMNLFVEVVDVGAPLDYEDEALCQSLAELTSPRVIVPKLKGQIHGNYIAIKMKDVNIICTPNLES